MASTAIPEAVLLDAQAFENASFNFASKTFKALKRHLQLGRLRLVITDITVAEVKSRIAKNVEKEVAAHTKFAKVARVFRSSPLAAGAVANLEAPRIIMAMHKAF